MAQLKDTIVSGNLRVTDTTLTDTLHVTTIKAPTSSGGTTYGPGTSGQVLKSNGTMTYWADMPTIPSNNVTGSGTSGYLTKWNGTNTITNGPQLGSSTTTFLRNDGSWATPTDTKVTSTLLAQSTAATTYLPTFVSAAGNSGVNIMNSFSFRHAVGTTSAVGNSRIVLGNSIASGTANNEEGEIVLYSPSTSYHTIKGDATTSAVTHTLPTTSGTILNTGNTSVTASDASNTGWSVLGIDVSTNGFILKSIRDNTTDTDWMSGGYGAGIAFGGSDTKGVISMRWNTPVITFAGGNHSSTNTSPTWYFKISGTSGKTYNFDNYLGAVKISPYYGMTDPDGADTNWIRTSKPGIIPYAKNTDTTDGNASSLGTSTWTFMAGYINDLHYKNLKTVTVVAGSTADNAIDKMAGSFFFSGAGLFGGVNDWVGIQAGYDSDKFQLVPNGTSGVLYRHNDTGGTDTTSWTEIKNLMTPEAVSGQNGITVTKRTNTLGTGSTALTYDSGVIIGHSNSVTAVTSAVFKKITYDAQGHITGTADVAPGDLPSHTHSYIPMSGSMGVTGNIGITKASGDTGFYAKRSDTGVEVWMGVGTGGTNHGIYSNKLGKWMMYGDASNVYLNGNATTASSWATAKTLTLSGQLTGSVSVKGDANMTLSGWLKKSLIYDDTSDFASYAWHKFAEKTITNANEDQTITFIVSKTWGNVPKYSGILTAHIRTGSTKVYDSSQFYWQLANSEIDPENFVFVYTNTADTSCKVELWYKQTTRYDGWIFVVLKEHSRTSNNNLWTLYTSDGHGSASHTTGTASYASSVTGIKIANINGVDVGSSPKFTDEKVLQSNTSTSDYRPIMLGTTHTTTIADLSATITGQAYVSSKMFAKSDTGYLYSSVFSTSSFINGTGSQLTSYGLYLKSYKKASLPAGGDYSYSRSVVRTYDGKAGDSSGMLLEICSGGLTIVGGGESASALAALITDDQRDANTLRTRLNVGGTLNTSYQGASEQLILSSDNNIYFITSCNAIANRKPVCLDTSSYFYPGTNKTGSIGTSPNYWASAYIENIHGTNIYAGKAGSTTGALTLYTADGSGSATIQSTSHSTNPTFLLPDTGNGTHMLSTGMYDLSVAKGSLQVTNVENIPLNTTTFKIVFKSDATTPIYSMVEIPDLGNNIDYSGLIQVGDYTDGQGSTRIIMKAVIIRITAGSVTGTRTFTATVSSTQKISGSTVSEFTRNVSIEKIYACT